jgi:hypothetical protein
LLAIYGDPDALEQAEAEDLHRPATAPAGTPFSYSAA